MTLVSGKPVWTQGMFMRPQHFQQQETYWDMLFGQHLVGRTGHGVGLSKLEIDEAALATGRFVVSAAEGIFPDGTLMRAPGNAILPRPRAFGAHGSGGRVFLAIPARRSDGPELAQNGVGGERHHRWGCETVTLRDSSQEEDSYGDVKVARLHPVLLHESERSADFEYLPIARIERALETEIVLDSAWLPPASDCNVHSGYTRSLADVRSVLHRRAETLAEHIDPNTSTGLSDTLDFLLLQTVNRHLARFGHMLGLKRLPPERAFAAMIELDGELATFTPVRRRRAQPQWNSADPGEAWSGVVRSIIDTLARISDRHGIQLPLQRNANGFWVAQIHDRSLLDSCRFILVARADDGAVLPSSQIPLRLKVGSVERLREIVALQLSGLPCRTMPVVPRSLPYYPGANYLEIDRSSPMWADIAASTGLAVHIMGNQSNIAVELWTLRQGDDAEHPAYDGT